MIAVIDATFLLLFLDPKAKGPKDPSTGKEVEKCRERIEHLIETVSKARTLMVIPTPVLAELLIIGRSPTVMEDLQGTSAFRIASFDQRAAVELALLTESESSARKKKQPSPIETKAKVKFDRQILAIAKTNQATTLYTDDRQLAGLAARNGLDAKGTHQLPMPPMKQQDWIKDEGNSK